MADWIPGISQLKSGFQLICGDVEGAANTQKNFFRQCPVVSQATSLAQLAVGDVDGALKTQKECGRTLGRVADGIPVVGHAKGVVHYTFGDTEGGNIAMRSATRTTAVMGAGAGGFLVGGPVGAVGAGIGAGAAMDTVYTVATDTPQGYYAAIDNMVKNPSAGGIFDAALIPVGDGMTGMAGGAVARSVQSAAIQLRQAGELYSRADAALQVAEANAGKVPDAVSIQQYNTAADLFNKAQALEAKATGTSVVTSGTPGKEGQASAATSAASRGSSVAVPVSGVESDGYDDNGDDNPDKRLARIKGMCEGNLTYRRRRTGRRPGIPEALNSESQTMQDANERIVTQMVEYTENVDQLPDGARTIIVDQLQASRALNEFHQFCARNRMVEVTLEFSGTRGSGETWEITFQINIDNVRTERQGPHLGYEIRTENLNRNKVGKQVGHVYLPRVPIGRPRLGQDYLLDQYRTTKTKFTLKSGPNAGLIVFFQCVITFFKA